VNLPSLGDLLGILELSRSWRFPAPSEKRTQALEHDRSLPPPAPFLRGAVARCAGYGVPKGMMLTFAAQ
jgi:hypothetical protein